ncbi:HrpB [Desulforapulum autotrophicum HRM2]|uniref:HrpB n=1 Tax=Desulforapulum autotrophicum (strain ATCC 43914 / DSM 3382 / VKM B-1955 / HRM2) TaxID=177437 RepID=C0QI12_DESAH|nr:ATP-dependent helicase HrpB [Desulforapulum autotrophicum]ACN15748.1 HrpB [Desulforapulum autotrophicum HRM2]
MENVLLPIDRVMPEIKAALMTNQRVIIKAPPGAGKTTRVPLALLDEPWLGHRNILVLEPRRIAARAAASRMSDLLHEPLGQTVGYHISMDRKVSPKTRIEVITEGILTRRIQSDPGLLGTGLVIFDEFHERNLSSDLGLALCLDAMGAFCEDLKIVVMSATLEAAPLCELMGRAGVVESQGKIFPVDTRYLEPGPGAKKDEFLEVRMARVILNALARDRGDILAFLPGVGEIRRTAALLNPSKLSACVSVLPLHGNLTQKDQDRAIQAARAGQRKVVLATAIAETSLTIEGVHVVVDSGLVREPRFSPRTGMSALETFDASKASVDQRRGRAGRTGPGICYRLWSRQTQGDRTENVRPEIFNTDLAGLALELALWGVRDPGELKWLDQPPKAAMDQARTLLVRLGALDAQGRIKAHGRALAGLGVHPRLGHMLLTGKAMGMGALACLVAAIVQEPDFMVRTNNAWDADLRLRVELLVSDPRSIRDRSLKGGTLARVRKIAGKLRHTLGVKDESVDPNRAGNLLALAYPERVAMNRNSRDGRFLLASGRGGILPKADPLAWEEMIVAAHVDGKNTNAKIFMAAPISRTELEQTFEQNIQVVDRVFWDASAKAVKAVKERCYMGLVLSSHALENPNPELILSGLLQGIRDQGVGILAWTPGLRRFQARAVFLNRILGDEGFPDLSDKVLEESLERWFVPFMGTALSMSRVKRMDLKVPLLSLLTHGEHRLLERHAPSHLLVPSGSKILLDYGEQASGCIDSPVLRVRIQEMFACTTTPTVAMGRVPVTIHLLSPAQRPVQVTQDLASFWDNTYAQVKKELKGRYPKHFWPDDPRSAPATRRTMRNS